MSRKGSFAAFFFAALLSFTGVALAEHPPAALARPHGARSGMSAMGKRAAEVRARIAAHGGLTIHSAIPSAKTAPGPAKLTVAGRPPGVSPIPSDGEEEEDGEPDCSVDPACLDEGELPRGGQAETSIAIDDSGKHIVVGFNDTRGFAFTQIRVSGFMYSDDGGKTFVDGGQLPGGPPDQFGFPQVFGDPDVKYLGACRFVYSSILLVVKDFGLGPAVLQTMSVHRSSDCGHTWEGPFEVTAASNPNGLVDQGSPVDAADKEFTDYDRRTGRFRLRGQRFRCRRNATLPSQPA